MTADGSGRAHRPLRWRTSLVAALAGALAWGAAQLPGLSNATSERLFGGGLGALVSQPLSRVTGWVPFSLGEVLVVAWLTWLLVAAALAVRAVAARRRAAPHAIAGGVLRVVRDLGVITFMFYAFWGFNYSRPAFESMAGWPAWQGMDVAELTHLAERTVTATNAAYLALHGVEDAGQPTRLENARALDTAVEQGWQSAAALLSLPPNTGARYGRAKRPLVSPLMERLGITGVFFPFTAEANVVRDLPAAAVAATLAHEKAHQRGYASEAEAGFLGYVAAAMAPDPLSRYGAALYAQNGLLSALGSADPDAHRRLYGMRLPGVVRDLRDLSAYYNRHRGVARAVGTVVNDRYLRAHQVKGGVQDYRRSTQLLVAFARTRDGDPIPPPHGVAK